MGCQSIFILARSDELTQQTRARRKRRMTQQEPALVRSCSDGERGMSVSIVAITHHLARGEQSFPVSWYVILLWSLQRWQELLDLVL